MAPNHAHLSPGFNLAPLFRPPCDIDFRPGSGKFTSPISNTMSTATPQTFEFQAEIKQLLDIVIHSLYTEKEIFVRELVSNASDALEKQRHLGLTEKGIYDDKLELEINITTDDKAKTFTIQDFGIGMTQAELVENLGTIAHSGSKAFLKALGEGDQKAAGLIGQFGVGFYSAFMVAKTVKVYTHSWREAEPGLLWTSDGAGSYAIEESPGERRGCKIVVELKDECAEFSQEWRVKRDPRALQRLRLLPDQPERQADQHGPGPLAARQERDQGGGVRRVLQVPGPRHREAPPAPALQRRRAALDQRAALRAGRTTPRSSGSPGSSPPSRSTAGRS